MPLLYIENCGKSKIQVSWLRQDRNYNIVTISAAIAMSFADNYGLSKNVKQFTQ